MDRNEKGPKMESNKNTEPNEYEFSATELAALTEIEEKIQNLNEQKRDVLWLIAKANGGMLGDWRLDLPAGKMVKQTAAIVQ